MAKGKARKKLAVPPVPKGVAKRTGSPESLLPGAANSHERISWRFTHVDHEGPWGFERMVVLAQLWGPMINLPRGIPMWTNDLRQECERLGNPPLPEQPGGVHNALADARHNRTRHQALEALAT